MKAEGFFGKTTPITHSLPNPSHCCPAFPSPTRPSPSPSPAAALHRLRLPLTPHPPHVVAIIVSLVSCRRLRLLLAPALLPSAGIEADTEKARRQAFLFSYSLVLFTLRMLYSHHQLQARLVTTYICSKVKILIVEYIKHQRACVGKHKYYTLHPKRKIKSHQ